ncbi:MAG: DUF177 domain-containing protein [Candidatus Poribacteria bacterium]|nr:DUF177 domain-containing protein [Candidatus Poribacteria bacterium]MDE0505933.1 DUF177 domain-containing protein [Candidatus Poribacteria bacterium]
MKALEFTVTEIPEEDLDIRELQVSPSEIGFKGEDFNVISPVHCHIQFVRHNQNIYTKAKFSTSLAVDCRRCIEPLQFDVTAEVEVQFCQVDDSEKVDPRLVDAGERHYSGESINLSEDARQGLVLEIPVWPLCSDSCKGLCAHCGTNLNAGECNCGNLSESSSPFSALSELLSDEIDGDRVS